MYAIGGQKRECCRVQHGRGHRKESNGGSKGCPGSALGRAIKQDPAVVAFFLVHIYVPDHKNDKPAARVRKIP